MASMTDELDLESGRTKNSAYKDYLDRFNLVAERYRPRLGTCSFYQFVERYSGTR